MITEVLINGARSDGRIPVTDSAVLRGDGCFEVVRTYGGNAFALDEHLDRLQRSAGSLGIALPPRRDLEDWVARTADELEDGAIRIVVTRGSSVPGLDDPPNVIVFGHTWHRVNEAARLLPVEAPWHAAGADWQLAGAKTISYAANMAATRQAQSAGFDDALLMTADGVMLEGPTFSVGWVVDGVLETPTLALGILDSITRRIVLSRATDLGIEVVEGSWTTGRLEAASEVVAWSTIREVQPVVAIGERQWQSGPMTTRLSRAYAELVG